MPLQPENSAIPSLVGRSDNSSVDDGLTYTHGLAGVDQIENYAFVNALVVFFFALAALSFVVRIAHNIRSYLRHINASGPGNERQVYWTQNQTSLWPWLKRNLVYAPLWNKHHNAELKVKGLPDSIGFGTLPSRYHTLLLAIYVLSNLAYCFVLDYSQENKNALLAELRGRSGVLAALNCIPAILFALRNNPLITILHVSFDTFNLFHRWAGRVVVLEVLLHVLAWAIVTKNASGWHGLIQTIASSMSFSWGTVGALAMFIIIILAWSPIRHAAYETFLNVHRMLAFFALLGIYKHLDTAKLPQLPYIQLVFVFWACEWAFRSYRLLASNFTKNRMTQCTVEALEGEACRVTFNLVRPRKFRPGAHVHAYIPSIGLWSSHPFSVAWTEEQTICKTKMIEMMPMAPGNKAAQVTEVDVEGAVPVVSTRVTGTSVTLLMKAKSGMTRKLYNKAKACDNGVLTTSGLIEGPYGGCDSLDSYGTVVLFAAGVGITHQLGYVRHLLQGYDAGTVATRKIVLAWAIPYEHCLDWIRPWLSEILDMPGRREALKILVYVSRRGDPQPNVSNSGMVQVKSGRCEIDNIIDIECANRIGAMAVTVCGPGIFADDVRHSTRRKVGEASVDYIEEAFSY